MKLSLNPYQKIAIAIYSIFLIEFSGIVVWALLTKSYSVTNDITNIEIFIIIFSIVFICSTLWSASREELVSDERIGRNIERATIFGGIASIIILTQFAILDIITGITCRAFHIFFIVFIVFHGTFLGYIIYRHREVD